MNKVRFSLAIVAILSGAAFALAAEPPKEFTNSLGQKFVLIPAGEFSMGASKSIEQLKQEYPGYGAFDDRVDDEYPLHKVRITKPFYFCRYETTNAQFRQFITDTGYITEGEQKETKDKKGPGAWGFDPEGQKFVGRDLKYNWKNPGFPIRDDMPVVNVSWNDTQAFLAWLSKKEGNTYRLPTEAEWEYSCRAGTTSMFWCGDDPETLTKNGNTADRDFFDKFPKYYETERCLKTRDGEIYPTAVGSFKPNPFGLYDMHGNVWEWTNDYYSETYYTDCEKQGTVDDPKGGPACNQRVRRGGAWHTLPLWSRSSFRNINTPVSRYPNLGFRVALEAK